MNHLVKKKKKSNLYMFTNVLQHVFQLLNNLQDMCFIFIWFIALICRQASLILFSRSKQDKDKVSSLIIPETELKE